MTTEEQEILPALERRDKLGRVIHPNRLANLAAHAYPPGVSGNASGERGPIVKPHYERYLTSLTVEELEALDESKLRNGEAIARKRILRALAPSNAFGVNAYKDADAIENRVDGMLRAANSATINVNVDARQVVYYVERETLPESTEQA